MTNNLPKKAAIIEVNNWGQPELPKKAERVYGKPAKGDQTGLYIDREGKVQTVNYRLLESKTTKGTPGSAENSSTDDDAARIKSRPDVTQKGFDMIGDFRTDALHEALARAPIEDDMLMALLVLAFAGLNVRVDSGAGGALYGGARFGRHAASLFADDGHFSFDMDTVRVSARAALIDVLSCRRGMSNSGVVARVAGDAIGADTFLPNMGTEDFLACLSRQAIEAAAKDANIQLMARARETRSALVSHFGGDATLIHPAALFAPDPQDVANLLKHAERLGDVEEGPTAEAENPGAGGDADQEQRELDGDDGAGTLDDHESTYGTAAE